MKNVSIKLDGTNELLKAIEKLPKELRKRAEKSAVKGGCAPILKAARSYVAVGDGDLRKSLGINVKEKNNRITARVGPRSGFKRAIGVYTKGKKKGKTKYKNPVNYAHLVEYGTSRTAAKPFIRPAVDNTKDEILDKMRKAFNRYIGLTVQRIKSKK